MGLRAQPFRDPGLVGQGRPFLPPCAGAQVLGPSGKPFTSASIGSAIATRAIMADLRAGGDVVGGPTAFSKADRSRFLSALDEILVRLKRSR